MTSLSHLHSERQPVGKTERAHCYLRSEPEVILLAAVTSSILDPGRACGQERDIQLGQSNNAPIFFLSLKKTKKDICAFCLLVRERPLN